MDFFMNQELVDFSSVTNSDYYAVAHTINYRSNESNNNTNLYELLNILTPSTNFLNFFLFTNLFYFLSIYLISSFIKNKSSNQINRKPITIQFLSVSYIVFIFLVRQLISNNIKTEKVIVDVSDLIYSKETLLNTKRKVCFIGKDNFKFNKTKTKDNNLNLILEKGKESDYFIQGKTYFFSIRTVSFKFILFLSS